MRPSGSPTSLLWLCSAATVRTCGRQSAARMSFVDVFPVANLGSRFLQDYAVTFDLQNRRMMLAR